MVLLFISYFNVENWLNCPSDQNLSKKREGRNRWYSNIVHVPKTVKKNSGKKSPFWCGIVGILRKWWIFKKLEIRNETVVLKTVWTTFLFKKQPSLQRGRNGEKTLLDIYHTSWRSPRCLVYWGSKKWVKNGDLWKSVDFLLTKTLCRVLRPKPDVLS